MTTSKQYKKISVIIPAHNEEEYIGKALTALFTQDYPDFEVIVVDNASTDRTAEIARSFPVTLLQEPRKGTMWACECGRKAAIGEIIVRMDADCVPDDPLWLTKGTAFFENPHVVGVSGIYYFYDHPSAFFRYLALIWTRMIEKPLHQIFQLLNMGVSFWGGNTFMRASTLEAIGGFNTDIVFWGDDLDTGKKLSKYGKIIFTTKLIIKSSGRRFQRGGIIKTYIQYKYQVLKYIFK